MTTSYLLAPNPKWYIADLTGRPLGGGYMATFRSLDKTEQKLVYQTQTNSFPWPYITVPNAGVQGILFDENGAQGPFYWEVDSTALDETYYIEVYDSDGVLQWTIDDFAPPGSGGGSIVTEATDLENLIINNVMWRNIGASANPVAATTLKLAPSAHAALAATSSNAGPDAMFIKNNTNAADQLTFVNFTLGDTPFTGDVTPVQYLKYVCANTPASETQKCVQFPITAKVQNLSNQDVTITVWARANSGTATLELLWRQFYGDGAGASPEANPTITTLSLGNTWEKYTVNTTVPNASTMVLGGCGNDALFLQIQYPLGTACDIDFIKPCVYIGNITPSEQYQSYDMIDSVINAPRTGYTIMGFDTSAPGGFVIMNDGSIGSASSAATTRANIDTFPLYNLLWNNVSNTYAPVSTGRGATAIADFTANKTLTLTRMLGRVLGMAGAGSGLTSRALGEYLGEESHTLTIGEMPSHDHPGSYVECLNTGSTGGANDLVRSPGVITNPIVIAAQGGGSAHNTMQPTSFMNFFIKL